MSEAQNSDPFAGYRDAKGRFLKGAPGRPPGYRHKITRAAEELMGAEVERLTRRVIDLALAGDPTALRIVFDRIAPPRRDPPLTDTIELPDLKTPADAAQAVGLIAKAAAEGSISPGEAQALTNIVKTWTEAHALADLEQRVRRLEGAEE